MHAEKGADKESWSRDASSHVQRECLLSTPARRQTPSPRCFYIWTVVNPLLDMDGDGRTASEVTGIPPTDDVLSIGSLSGILAPGSSLNPTFLLVLDGTLATLLLVLLGLFVVTNYNFHLLFLSIIEICLWASIKW